MDSSQQKSPIFANLIAIKQEDLPQKSIDGHHSAKAVTLPRVYLLINGPVRFIKASEVCQNTPETVAAQNKIIPTNPDRPDCKERIKSESDSDCEFVSITHGETPQTKDGGQIGNKMKQQLVKKKRAPPRRNPLSPEQIEIRNAKRRAKHAMRSLDDRERRKASQRIESLTKEQIAHRNAKRREKPPNISLEARERRKASRRVAAMSKEQIERRNANRRESARRMSEQNRAKQNASRRIDSLSQDHIDHLNQKRKIYVDALTPERRERRRLASKLYRASKKLKKESSEEFMIQKQ